MNLRITISCSHNQTGSIDLAETKLCAHHFYKHLSPEHYVKSILTNQDARIALQHFSVSAQRQLALRHGSSL